MKNNHYSDEECNAVLQYIQMNYSFHLITVPLSIYNAAKLQPYFTIAKWDYWLKNSPNNNKIKIYKTLDDFKNGGGFYIAVQDVLNFMKPADPASVEYGVVCSKCKQDYPYQVKKNNFICWGCKNGY